MKRNSACFFAILIALYSYQIFAETKEEIALVSFLLGKVKVFPASGKESARELKLNERILAGDTIVTEVGSKVTILYKGSEFKIASNASVTIHDLYGKNKTGKVEVNHGLAWFKLVNLKGKFEVQTPASTAGVRGTSFATLYDEELKQAMNCVCEGKVEIQSRGKNAKKEMVVQGKGSSINFGMTEISKADYKDEIEKGEKGKPGSALPLFEKRIQKAHLMKSCLSCHVPKGWSLEDKKDAEPRDEAY